MTMKERAEEIVVNWIRYLEAVVEATADKPNVNVAIGPDSFMHDIESALRAVRADTLKEAAEVARSYVCELCARTGPSGHGCCCLDGVAEAIDKHEGLEK